MRHIVLLVGCYISRNWCRKCHWSAWPQSDSLLHCTSLYPTGSKSGGTLYPTHLPVTLPMSEERCELPQRGLGRAPAAQRFSTIFSIQDSWHYNIVNYCGLLCSHWGGRPRASLPCVRLCAEELFPEFRNGDGAQITRFMPLLLPDGKNLTILHSFRYNIRVWRKMDIFCMLTRDKNYINENYIDCICSTWTFLRLENAYKQRPVTAAASAPVGVYLRHKKFTSWDKLSCRTW